MLRLDLCNYNDACIVVKGTIDVLAAAANENDKAQKSVLFKSNAPFRSPENTRKPPPLTRSRSNWKSTTTTSSTSFKCWGHYSTQIS